MTSEAASSYGAPNRTSAPERRRGRPLVPGFLDQNPGRVDVLPRLGFPIQNQNGEAALRRSPGAGESRETGPDHKEIVVGTFDAHRLQTELGEVRYI